MQRRGLGVRRDQRQHQDQLRCGPIHLGRWTAEGGCPYMSLGTQGPSTSPGMTGLRINSNSNGSGRGRPLYIWVDSGWRPDTPGPLDSRGRVSLHEPRHTRSLDFARDDRIENQQQQQRQRTGASALHLGRLGLAARYTWAAGQPGAAVPT